MAKVTGVPEMKVTKLPRSKCVTLDNGKKIVWLQRKQLKSYAIGVMLFNKEGKIVSTSRFGKGRAEALKSIRELARLVRTGGKPLPKKGRK